MIPGARRWLRRVSAGVWVLALLLASVAPALGADPTASPGGGDVRTSATAPGMVGDPLFALAGVVVIGLIAAGATFLYVRLTSRR